MSTFELVERLRALDIALRLDGEQLRVDAPAGALTAKLREELAARKAELVNVLRAAASRDVVRRPITRVARDAKLPLSHGQQRLWLLDQLQPGTAAYVLRIALRLRGSLDTSALEAAVGDVVRRHEALRTVFGVEDGVPHQIVQPPQPVPMPVVDLQTLPADERVTEALELAARDALTPMDLSAGPLLRVRLLRLAPDEHVLLVAIHHIIFDGWSATIFLRELGICYRAQLDKGVPPLAEPQLHFVDFASWQRSVLDDSVRAQQLAHWMHHLKGDRQPLDLPADRPRKSAIGTGAHCMAEIPADVSAGLESLCRQTAATRSMVLLATLQLLLHRLTGETDIVVGTPIAGRSRPETETMIGFFMNTVVMRATLEHSQSFRELLTQVRDASLGAYAHQDMPFEELVNALEPQRDLLRTPLFQIFFNYLNIELPDLQLPGCAVERFGPHVFESRFDLTLYVFDESGVTRLVAAYNADLFDAPRMRELLDQYVVLLQQVAREPDRHVDDYSLLTEHAKRALPSGTQPLASLQQQQTTLTFPQLGELGDRLAVSTAAGDSTYAELDERADRLAQELLAARLERGEIVAILAARGPELVWALLGVLRAGGAFCLLDPAYPDIALAERWRAAAPRVLVTIGAEPAVGGALEGAIAESDTRLRLALMAGELGQRSTLFPVPVITEDDVAYVAFTSGTSGGVKAIVGKHGPVAHFLEWQRRTFALDASDRFTLLSGLAHDPLLRDIFAPLWSGAVLCVPSSDTWRDPAALASWLRNASATVVHLTPALAQLITAEFGAERSSEAPLRTLRYAFFGGDVLTADTVTQTRCFAPLAQCVNFYGATETPQAMGYQLVDHSSSALPSRIPIGRGIDGVELIVLTARNRIAGIGEIGEIVIRTKHLAHGYLGEPTLTAQRFIVNPLNGDPADRVYRTGDLGRFLPNGAVEFAGRRDGQVKVRGFRVELGEVDAAIRAIPGVAQVATVLQHDGGAEPQLVAYVVCTGDTTLDAADARRALAHRLPNYSVPAAFMTLSALPLTPNGKLDRRALPAPQSPISTEYEAPRTSTEQLIAAMYAEVLRRDEVSRNDSFFELGGHSLLGARLIARVRAELGVALPLRTLFEEATPAGLAGRIDRVRREKTADELPELTRRQDMLAPLSFAQQRMWFLDQLEPGNTAYLIPGALTLEGDLDVAALGRALSQIVRRHEVLRTVFRVRDGTPYQEVRPAPDLTLAIEDLRALPERERQTEARRRALAGSREPMHLAEGPLLRVNLLREGERRHVLVVVVHHAVFDGWSGAVLMRELATLYAAERRGHAAPLSELPVQYADYAVWQRQWLRGDALARELSYWRERLAGAAVSLELPTDRPRPPVVTYRGARTAFVLSKPLHQRLAQLSRREGATLFMTLLAAFQVLLSRYSGQNDVVIGTPVANRTRPELEGLIGFFVNTLVLRTQLTPEDSFRELLRRVREVCLGAYAHQDLPFERLVEALSPPRDTSRNPVFQVMFALQNMELPALELPGLSVEPFEFERTTAQVDLTLYVMETAEGLRGTLEYSTDLFERQSIERLAAHWQCLLAHVVEAPDTPIAQLRLLEAAEQDEWLRTVNETRRAYPREATVLDLFRAQVERRGERVAVQYSGTELSYLDLETRSNRLARHLQSLGVAPGALVGLCLERSADIVVAILATWKAGAAYLPLDPSFPSERLDYMLQDSAAKALVTQSSLRERLTAVSALQVVEVDSDRATIDMLSALALPAAAEADRRAYVIYTSGSTGRPKGVEVPHRALTNFLCSMAKEPGIGENDVLLAVTTISFDISLLELFLPLTVGARLVVAPSDTTADGRQLAQLLTACNATAMQATPSSWRLLIAAGWNGHTSFKALCGGEAFPPDLAKELCERCGEVWNMYGPTETTVWSTCERIVDPAAPISIGRPIANTAVYVLDREGQPVPPLVAGELFIGGDGVALGYLNRPELTAERFVRDAFAGTAGARMYRTGDQARWLPDGRLQHLGRLDSQVKIRGFRIELGEIETALRNHPDVRESAASVWDAAPGDQRLVAYVVAHSGSPAVADLRKHLRAALPDYMIPQHFVDLAALPLTPNGKLDRKALPPPVRPAGDRVDANPPQGPSEELIAAVWKEVIGDVRVSRTDNFFDLGGHSLLAIRAIALIEERTGWQPPPRLLILENLQEIAARCAEATREKPAPAAGFLTRLKRLIRTAG
jgi:amino acid adenylation domain-containing protein